MAETLERESTATQGGQNRWAIDSVHSSAEFAVKHMVFSTVKGRFTEIEGTFTVDDADPTRSAAAVTIGTASIDTHDEKRDGHLRSADFFDAEQFPTLTFASTRVEPSGGDRFRLLGDLTMHGVTREVAFDVTFNGRGTNPWGQEVSGYTAETTINRKDFGLNWNLALEAGGVMVGDKIKIVFEVEATKQA